MVLRLSGSPMPLPPPPEPPPVTFLLDLASMIAPPDLPVLPDHSGAPDLFSFILKIAEPPPVSGTATSSSACLLLVSLGVNFVMPWLPHTAVCRVQFYYILWRKSSFPPLLLGFVLKDTVFVTPLIESELVGFCCTSSLTELNSRSQSPPLSQYEAFRLWFSLPLPQCEVLLPLYEVHLPQYEVVNLLLLCSLQYICMLVFLTNISGISYRKLGDDFIKTNLGFLAFDLVGGLWSFIQFHAPSMLRISSLYSGSSRWCVVTSVAKFVAAFHAFYAAACSDSSSLCVFSDSHGFISLSSTLGISILSCLCVMYASIQCVFVSRIAFDAAVYLTSMVALLYLNNSFMVGV
ncbi:putative transmembrane protein At3g54730 [Brassica napus]|uniref:putative transmembrane protein At3g54730 n=1 Tax=Brassica napus TaxID=3708 RepID=UPI0020795DF1|nr:putative transmembrane protein At3g54730 [Brassica napus]